MVGVTPAVNLSIFELFKIGPGPSSSHTIGPMAAGLDFRQRVLDLPGRILDRASGFRVVLLGSLSATGQGHGTDRAVAAGLLGWVPEKVATGLFSDLLRGNDPGVEVDLCGRKLALTPGDIEYGPLVHDHPHANTLLIELTGPDGPLFEKTYYSVGGGFIQWDGYQAPERGRPKYPYGTMRDLMRVTAERDLTLAEVLIANEAAVFGASAREIHAGLDRIIDVMDAAVTRGLAADGMLPGLIGLSRKASGLFDRAAGLRRVSDRMLAKLNAYALAAAEENAAGGIVVTAPTLGSAGVIPAVLRHLRAGHGMSRLRLRQGLLTAAAIGFLIKWNASIAGAEVGCQGEIGAASAMASGLLCTALGYGPDAAAAAAEIALEHHLGLTCDPVMGYVQIPCVERNAMGAAKAYNAFILASAGDLARQKVGFDVVVEVMLETGRDMSGKYKETSQGGLAVNLTEC